MSNVTLSSKTVIDNLTAQIKTISDKSDDAKLALIKVGTDHGYEQKEKKIVQCCNAFNINVWTLEFPDFIPEDVLAKAIYTVSQDDSIDGILILCNDRYNSALLGVAAGNKDVEGRLYSDNNKYLPAIITSTLYLLSCNNINCKDKKIFVIYSNKENLIYSAFKDTVFARNTIISEHNIDLDSNNIIVPGNINLVLSLSKEEIHLDFTDSNDSQVLIDAGIKYNSADITGGIKKDNLKNFTGKVSYIPNGIDEIIPYIIVLNTWSSKQEKNVDKS